MKRLLLLLLFAIPTWATTTVTGHIVDLGTIAATPNAFVRFTLRGCGGNQPTVPGVGVLAPTQGAVWFKDFPANSSGNVSGTIYSSRDATGLLGGDIQCGGSFTAVWFGMTVWVGGKSGPEVAVHTKNTATLDVSSVTPITMNPVVAAPTGDSTYARLDGGNSPFFGNIGFTNQMNANGGGTLNGTFGGTPTFSGLSTFNSGIAGSGGNLLYPTSSCPTITINGQANIVCNWLPVLPSNGITQQIALGAFINGASTAQLSSTNFRIGGFFGATTGAGGEAVLALNAAATAVNGQPNANTQVFQAGLNNNQVDPGVNCTLPACYTGFTMGSFGTFPASIGFNVGGTGKWYQGFEIDQGAITTGGYAFNYKGDGTHGNALIRRDSTLELGFASALGNPDEIHLSNNTLIQSLNAASSALIPIAKVNASNVIEVDPSTVGVQLDGTVSVGGGSTVNKILRASGLSLNSAFTSITAPGCQEQTITLSGAAVAGAVVATPQSSIGLQFSWNAYVSSSNTITVRACAFVTGTPSSVTWNVMVVL